MYSDINHNLLIRTYGYYEDIYNCYWNIDFVLFLYNIYDFS